MAFRDWTESDRTAFADLWSASVSVNAMARRFDCGKDTIRRGVVRFGLTPRPYTKPIVNPRVGFGHIPLPPVAIYRPPVTTDAVTCQWIVDGAGRHARFCDAPSARRSYCAKHAAVVFTTPAAPTVQVTA